VAVKENAQTDVGVWAGMIVTTYVGGRSLEKIARTIWHRR
jgi:hypothetical protein